LWALSFQILDRESLEEMIFETDNEGKNIFHFALRVEDKNYQSLEFFFNEASLLINGDEEKMFQLSKLLTARIRDGKNIFEDVAEISFEKFITIEPSDKPNISFVQTILKSLHQQLSPKHFKDFLTSAGSSIVRCGVRLEDINWFLKILNENFTEPSDLKIFFPDLDRASFALNRAAEFCNEEVFKSFSKLLFSIFDSCELKKLLIRNGHTKTLLHAAIKNEHDETLNYVINLFEKNLETEVLKEILLETNGLSDGNIFIYVLEKAPNYKSRVERILSFIKKIFNDEQQMKEKFKKNFTGMDLMIAAQSFPKDKFEILWVLVCEVLDDRKTQEELLLMKIESYGSIFHNANKSRNKEILEYCKEIYSKFLTEDELTDLEEGYEIVLPLKRTQNP
jgi:hypothetical protein